MKKPSIAKSDAKASSKVSLKVPTKATNRIPVAPKYALHTKIMRMSDGSCTHMTSVCTMTITTSGQLERTVIQNVQDRANHPRWSGISTATDTNTNESISKSKVPAVLVTSSTVPTA